MQYGNAYVPHSASAAQSAPQNLPLEHCPFTQLPHPLLEFPLQSDAVAQGWPQAGWHTSVVAFGTFGVGAHTEHVALQSAGDMHVPPQGSPTPQTPASQREQVELALQTPSLLHFVPHAPLHLPLTHDVQYGNAYVPHSALAAQVSPQNLPCEHCPFTQLPHPPLPAPLQSEEVEQVWLQAGWHVGWVALPKIAHTEHDELQSVATPHAVPHFPPSTQSPGDPPPPWQNVHVFGSQSPLFWQAVLQVAWADSMATRAATQRMSFIIMIFSIVFFFFFDKSRCFLNKIRNQKKTRIMHSAPPRETLSPCRLPRGHNLPTQAPTD